MTTDTVTINVTDSLGTTVSSNQPLSLDLTLSGTLPIPQVGVPYAGALGADGGVPPYNWSISELGQSDPDFASVRALLHFDGPDGSTVFTDEAGGSWTVYGDSQIDTEYSVFGGASGLFGPTAGTSQARIEKDIGTSDSVTGDFTFECRCRTTYNNASTSMHLMGRGNGNANSNNDNTFSIYVLSGIVNFAIYYGGSSFVEVNGSTFIADGNWHSVIFRRTGNVFTLHVDGALDGSTTQAVSLNAHPLIRVGGYRFFSTSYRPWIGNIDEFRCTLSVSRDIAIPTAPFPDSETPASTGLPSPLTIDPNSGVISGTINSDMQLGVLSLVGTLPNGTVGTEYSGALSVVAATPPVTFDEVPTTLDQHYNDVVLLMRFDGTDGSTSFVDSSPLGVTVSAFGSPTISTVQSRFGGSSGLFNGTSQYLRADAALAGFTAAGTAITVEAWVYRTATGTSPHIFGLNKISDGTNEFVIGCDTCVFNNASTAISYTLTVPINEWTHVAATHDGTTARVFINGTLVANQVVVLEAFNTCVLGIGAEFDAANGGTPGNYFPGYIDEVRVTQGVARYTANFTPPITPFPAAAQGSAFPAGLSLNSTTGRISGIPTTPGSNTFTLRVTDGTATTATSEQTVVITSPGDAIETLGPVAYWKLNEPPGATVVVDSSGNGYDLSVIGGTVTFGSAGLVTGTTSASFNNSYISSTNNQYGSTLEALFDYDTAGDKEWSMVAVADHTVNTDDAIFHAGHIGTSGSGGLLMDARAGLELRGFQHIVNSTGSTSLETQLDQFPLNTPYLWIVRKRFVDVTNFVIEIFRNGTLNIATANQLRSVNRVGMKATTNENGFRVTIGGRSGGTAFGDSYSGRIQNVALFDKCLSDAEIASIAAEFTP